MLWNDASEITAGLCIKQRLNPAVINPMSLFPPYDIVVSMLTKGFDTTDIIEKVGLNPVQTAISASDIVDNKLPADWVSILEVAASRADASSTFKRAAEKLSQGEDPDYGRITESLEKLQRSGGSSFITLDKVDASEAVWRKTYYPPFDKHLGNATSSGIPEAGLCIIGAPPGCLVGDTRVSIHHSTSTITMTMKELEFSFNGGIRPKGNGRPWNKSIPTYTRSMKSDGTLRLNQIEAVLYSGDKECFTLTTEQGHVLTGTGDHPVYTPTGRTWLSELQPGDLIYVDGGRSKGGRKTRIKYYRRTKLFFHPYAGRKEAGKYEVQLHRLIFEANLNNLNITDYIQRCRTGEGVDSLIFINPSEWAIHHKDKNIRNNDLSNLQKLTVEEHQRMHHETGTNFNFMATTAIVKSVNPVGTHPTYDISMRNEPHNFLANGIVVSNTGKTSLLVKLMGCAVQAGKKVCLISLEMTNGQIVNRFIETSGLTLEERSRIISAEDRMTLDEVYMKVSRLAALEELHFIGVDFADLLLDSAEDEASVAHVYRTMAKLAKATGVPVILLSQLNREYVGGIPRIHNLRYSGLAEAMGALILLLYNPGQTWSKLGEDPRLPIHAGCGYIIVGKSRFGYREGGLGAIEVEWDGLSSFGLESKGWYSLS